MSITATLPGRTEHWIRPNHATRSPHRWVVLDSEAHRTPDQLGERQTYRLAVARRWNDDGGKVRNEETIVADTPEILWKWIGDFVRPGKRTVLWCHNLDYDLQVTRAFYVLPALGWDLMWSNLDSQVSMCKWTRDGATLVMTDTYTWCPQPLEKLGNLLGMDKPSLPADSDSVEAWITRCMADVDITTRVVREILGFVRENELGNMQMSGAGMGYAMWRHKFLDSKILVHANEHALQAEREAMHTGRAETWRHGVYSNIRLTEWDLTNAYTRIARDSDLPRKLVRYDPNPTIGRYRNWAQDWRVLMRCRVTTETPCVPAPKDGRIIWPVGTFDTTLWDCEVDLALAHGATIEPVQMWGYLRAPIMRKWAEHTLSVLQDQPDDVPPIMQVWYRHQARATIGRCGLRYTQWEQQGPDWVGMTGLSLASYDGGQTTVRLLHLGGKVWEETGRTEGRDSLPQIPSWIAARCRVILWEAMDAVGADHLWYVDTDSVMVDDQGDKVMRVLAGLRPEAGWRVKGIYRSAELHGPRQIVMDNVPRIAGVPKRAKRTGPAEWKGEVWQRAAGGLQRKDAGSVLVEDRTWDIQWSDPRREHVDNGRTEALRWDSVPTPA